MLKFVLLIYANKVQDKYEVVLLKKPPKEFLHLLRLAFGTFGTQF